MANFIVDGGKLLEGEIAVRGSKNSALPALASSLLFKGKVEFLNMPEIEDIKRARELLSGVENNKLDYEIAKKIRASILMVGPALARFGKIFFPHPGGCSIGARPIDLFLEGWRAMGAEVSSPLNPIVANGGRVGVNSIPFYEIKAPHGLRGCDYTFRTPSVTGTEGLMMTAVLAQGKTILRNSAIEPEVKHLADFLNKNGADIRGAGTHEIVVEGSGGGLLSPRLPFVAPPDRIETGSFIILGLLAAKKLRIKNCAREELSALSAVLKDIGADLEFDGNDILVKKSDAMRAVNIKTKEYPGFPTDLQAPFSVLLTQAEGVSMVHETIFEGRLNYIEDLNRMGAKITLCDPHRALITGPTPLHGRSIEGPDIRAGLAFLIAALIAKGETAVGNIYQIDRGYERIDDRLSALGARIKRI